MKKLLFSLVFLGFLLALAGMSGCASSASTNSYPRSAARTGFDVHYGEVVSVRAVEIEGEATMLGRFGGAWIGYALGRGDASMFTSARRLETAVGGVAGTVAGEALERRARTEEGLEVVVRLDASDTIAVVQGADVAFTPGDRVQVLIGRDGSTRVQPL